MESIDPDPLPGNLIVILSDVFSSYQIEVIVTVIVLLVLLLMSGLISGSETAFFSLERSHLEFLKEKNTKTSAKVLKLIANPKQLLATILITNNFINVAIVILSTFLSTFIVDDNSNPLTIFLIQVVLITSVILLFGEIIPKIIANGFPITISMLMSGPLIVLEKILKPLSYLLVSSTSFIDRKIGDQGHNITMSELSEAIEMTIEEGAPEDEKMILKGIASFGDKEASEIMKSRMDIFAINAETDFKSMMEMSIESGYSRIPVYEDSIDKVLGIFYVKDLLPFLGENEKKDWVKLLRPVFYVPENKRINDLLQDFRTKKIHMAVVVDEYGGTSGIITLEDIIEEIVGEISDEFDDDEELEYKILGDNKYRFLAKTPINDFCKVLNIDDETFNAVKGESDSLGGMLLEINGNIPQKGSIIEYQHFAFRVIDVDTRKLKEIEVTVKKSHNEK